MRNQVSTVVISCLASITCACGMSTWLRMGSGAACWLALVVSLLAAYAVTGVHPAVTSSCCDTSTSAGHTHTSERRRVAM